MRSITPEGPPLSDSGRRPDCFDLQADWGTSKHLGGLKATRELLELCQITQGQNVLYIGSGTGIAPCYIAKTRGCYVRAIDISEGMIARSQQRATREHVLDRVGLVIGDAQSLPFVDEVFDAVIGESVTPFMEDKRKAVSEYVRVLKPGGRIGLNESFWLKPPPAELVEYIRSSTDGAEVLTSDGWKELLQTTGVKDVRSRTYAISRMSEFLNQVRWFGPRDLALAWSRFAYRYLTSADLRRYFREMWRPRLIRQFYRYMGYGLYVGSK